MVFCTEFFWIGGGLESRCVGRVCGADGADGAVRRRTIRSTFTFINSPYNYFQLSDVLCEISCVEIVRYEIYELLR